MSRPSLEGATRLPNYTPKSHPKTASFFCSLRQLTLSPPDRLLQNAKIDAPCLQSRLTTPNHERSRGG